MKFFKLNSHLSRQGLLLIAVGLLLLSFLTSWYFHIQPSATYHQKKIQRYIQNQQKDVNALLADQKLARKLVLKTETEEEFRELGNKDYGLFLFAETISDNQDLLFWNTQRILPPKADFSLPDGEYFQKLSNGDYFIQKTTLRFDDMSNTIVAYMLVPVFNNFYLTTDYTEEGFVHDENANKQVEIAENTKTNFPVKSASGKTLFYLREVSHARVGSQDILTILLRVISFVFLLTFLHLVAESIVQKRRALYGIVFLALSFIVLRFVLYQFPRVLSFRQFELFDPSVYAANSIHSSLGDLLINAVLFCWLILFAWYSVGPVKNLPNFIKGPWVFITGVACVFILIFSTFQLANIVRSLVTDSKISFNVTNFFSLDIYTVIGLIVLALVSLSYYYFTRILFRFIFSAFRDRYIYIYFILGAVGLIYLTFQTGNPIVLFHLPVLFWLMIYTLLVSQEKFIINRFRITVAGALFWILVFSVSLSVIILAGNREKEIANRIDLAEKYDDRSDQSNTNMMSIATAYLDNRYLLANFNRFKNEDVNRYLRDSILQRSYDAYQRRFDTKLYLFDSTGQAVNNDDPRTFAELNTIFTVQSNLTTTPDLNYVADEFNRLTYITKRQIIDSGKLIGTFFIVSTPRQYGGTETLSAKFSKQVSKKDEENSSIYLYAIYRDLVLQESSSKYPFPVRITQKQVPAGSTELVDNRGYSELWYKVNNRKIIVIAKKKDSFFESITLFSYLFCAFLFMVGILQIIALLLRLLNERKSFDLFSRFNIRTQIHGTVIFISILSFLIIGAATISFFISRYNRTNIDRISRTADIMVRELEKRLRDTTAFSPGLTDSISWRNMQTLVGEVADIHNADVNIYDLDGNLKVTSEDYVYNKGVISTKIHPLAFYHLDRLHEVQYVQKEDISALQYWSIYAAVRDPDKNVVYYLNIPYFSSQIDLKQEISNFLVTIINLNAFIFLIAGIIALFITNTITKSFSVIGEKMKAITLGKTNEEIVWTKNDEIGVLVNQYNKMVRQLEQSAEALARSEREGAWREMARQVAHEIKNPLTPMKLSIQYLQKAIDSGQGNVKDLTANVANTLIEQIDHLSKIAADFSQFANIGNKKIELVDLHQVIGILVDLYNSNPKVKISWNRIAGSIVMKADKTQMNRVFTNLLANAVDACHGKSDCRINIDEVQKDGIVTISVADNGEGIPEEMRHKIFTPNFTTKTSGTGLGLAMCKSIIEQANGKIWFETEEGRGTTFYVQLPVIS